MEKIGCYVIAALCGLAGVAGAQVRPEAEKLFRDGKELVRQGKIAEACAAFEASEKADHSIATVMSLADCRERNLQYASAWALFLQADSQTRTDASKALLNRTARARAAALEPRLSYLTINVPDESQVTDLVVSRDGLAIDRVEWNRSIPIDGGLHEISGKAPGHESWSTKVTIAPERDKQSVEVPKFKELPKLVTPHPRHPGEVTPGRSVDITPGVSRAVARPPSMFTSRRKLAVGLAAGGVVLAGVGVGFGMSARSLDDQALARCPSPSCGAQAAAEARALNDRARGRALVANIGFAAGGAAVIAGAVLWYIGGPRAPEVTTPLDDTDGDAASPRRSPRRQIAISPQGGETNGLIVWGRF
jgi:hypothetical protein